MPHTTFQVGLHGLFDIAYKYASLRQNNKLIPPYFLLMQKRGQLTRKQIDPYTMKNLKIIG